jgi:hypothetical protein
MGYTTDFSGSFDLNKPLAAQHKAYLEKFAQTRRMERDQTIASKFPDPIREAAGLPIGEQGGYFVGGLGFLGQDSDASVTNHNIQPDGQHGLWCQWVPNEDGTSIQWDGGEKFYDYVEWIEYIVEHFIKPWGYVLNGEVEWYGECRDDAGLIIVDNNSVTTKTAVISYE